MTRRQPHRLGPGLYRRRRGFAEAVGPTALCSGITAVIVAAALLLTHMIVS